MRKPDLIVPVRDRRQRRRILTLKNFARVAVVLVIFLAGIIVEANLRRPGPSSSYGRLFGKQVSGQSAVQPRKVEIVTPAIEDQKAADPLLVDAQRREQYLGSVDPALSGMPPAAGEPAPRDTGIVITRGNPEASQPLLSGGIFRQ